MSASSPSEPANQHPTAGADAVRVATAEVLRRVNEWRESPRWRDDDANRERYDRTVRAADALDELSESAGAVDVTEAVRPIIETWRPNRVGPEQATYAAVDRLLEAIHQLTT